jgi:hypothetical protein
MTSNFFTAKRVVCVSQYDRIDDFVAFNLSRNERSLVRQFLVREFHSSAICKGFYPLVAHSALPKWLYSRDNRRLNTGVNPLRMDVGKLLLQQKAHYIHNPLRVNECTSFASREDEYQTTRTGIPVFLLRLVINPEGRVRLDVPPACDPVSRQGMKTHDLSIPTNLCHGLPPLPEQSPIPVRPTVGKP